MIAIVDYNMGNVFSLTSAIERCGGEYIVTSSAEQILSASSVIIPGVGAADQAMKSLIMKGLENVIPRVHVPLLGICIGMQLLCSASEEIGMAGKEIGNVCKEKISTKCLGIFPGEVKRFSSPALKVPHMGWNSVQNLKTPLFEGIDEESYLYFVHSYYCEPGEYTIAGTVYGSEFSSALRKKNFFGTQFHPEKSGATGERILKNFINLEINQRWI